jgi:hypothetical protein
LAAFLDVLAVMRSLRRVDALSGDRLESRTLLLRALA